jgi:hypothetical protein
VARRAADDVIVQVLAALQAFRRRLDLERLSAGGTFGNANIR